MKLNGLKYVIDSQGLSYGQISKATGISKTHISRLATKASGSSPETAVNLARALNVSVTNLIDPPNLVKVITELLGEVREYKRFVEKAFEDSGAVLPDLTKQNPYG